MRTSTVQLCRDMRFGRDDYVLYPQWYHDEYPHLSAMPRRPLMGEESPFACMWYSPTQHADFTLVAARADGYYPGFLHERIISELLPFKEELKEDALRYLQRHPTEGLVNDAVRDIGAAISFLVHTWLILTSNAAGFDEKCLELSEFQRAWLDLKGMLDYRRWKEDSELCRIEAALNVRDCVGCIVESLPVAMALFDMRIPVWLVRDKLSVLRSKVYIQHATSSCQAPELLHPPICIERNTLFDPIYHSTPRESKHYQAQRRFARTRPVSFHSTGSGQHVYRPIQHDQAGRPNVGSILVELAAMRSLGAPFPEATSSGAASSSTSSSSSRHQGPGKFPPLNVLAYTNPCLQLPRRLQSLPNLFITELKAHVRFFLWHYAGCISHVTLDAKYTGKRAVKDADLQTTYKLGKKFEERTGAGEPYAIPAWIAAVNELDIRRLRSEQPPPHHYTVPPPFVFTSANATRQVHLICSWLHIRPMWLGQMRRWSGAVPALKAQTWRDVLRFSIGGPAGPHTAVDGANMRQIQEDFAKVNLVVSGDGRVITFDNGQQLSVPHDVRIGAPNIHRISWRGRDIDADGEGIPATVKMEVLWELHEVGFRCDLATLDSVLCRVDDDITHRQDRLSRCWSMSGDGFYDPGYIDWPSRDDVGLASCYARDRLPFIRSLYGLCCTWEAFPIPRGVNAILNHGLSSQDIQGLEAKLIRQLEQTYYDVFARAMVAPRRLFWTE